MMKMLEMVSHGIGFLHEGLGAQEQVWLLLVLLLRSTMDSISSVIVVNRVKGALCA